MTAQDVIDHLRWSVLFPKELQAEAKERGEPGIAQIYAREAKHRQDMADVVETLARKAGEL